MLAGITQILGSVGSLATSYIDGKTAIQKAAAEHCPTSKAWIMRRAFDHVIASSN